jgi:hypothetical protein
MVFSRYCSSTLSNFSCGTETQTGNPHSSHLLSRYEEHEERISQLLLQPESNMSMDHAPQCGPYASAVAGDTATDCTVTKRKYMQFKLWTETWTTFCTIKPRLSDRLPATEGCQHLRVAAPRTCICGPPQASCIRLTCFISGWCR